MNNKQELSKLWESIVNIEVYFQEGIIEQLSKSPDHFGGEDAKPIYEANARLKEIEPFIDTIIFSLAEKSINLAADEFNKIINTMREQNVELFNTTLLTSLKRYRESIIDLKKHITPLIKDKESKIININGDNYGQLNVADHISSPVVNMTISELIQKIDNSNLPSNEKENLKSKINDLISHPLLTSILGGISGAMLG